MNNISILTSRPRQGIPGRPSLVPATDVIEKADRYDVLMELPGVNKDRVNITLQEGVLTINAHNHEEKTDPPEQGARVISQQLRRGHFVHSLRLGSSIDETGINANFKDGILSLRLPKAREAQPRRIEVKAG